MIRRMFRRCATGPGTLSPEDQAAVDAFRAMLAARRSPEPWIPGHTQDIAVRIGPFIERAHTRPGDDHGPDIIAIALQHPDGPHAPYDDRYRTLGWLRCETTQNLGAWNPAYAVLTHAEAGLDLPDDTGMTPAHYAVLIEARKDDVTGYTILRLGPYTQAGHTSRDAYRSPPPWTRRKRSSPPGSRSPRGPRRTTPRTTRGSSTRTRPTPSRSWPPLSKE